MWKLTLLAATQAFDVNNADFGNRVTEKVEDVVDTITNRNDTGETAEPAQQES